MPHKYIPNQQSERDRMLSVIGLKSEDELFDSIPVGIRMKNGLDLPSKQNELDVTKALKKLASMNKNTSDQISFLGAGVYDHYIPSVVDALASRTEFYTSYTPYQPEISQGTLQAIFEYQSAMCELTGMDISNASMYDGASALYEACSLAVSHTGINRVILSSKVHPEYLQTVRTGLSPFGTELVLTDSLEDVQKALAEPASCIVVQNPNFYGVIEDIQEYIKQAKDSGCLSIISVDPISLAILEPPGPLGADIVVGDGQSLGCYANLGGPHFGFFCVTEALIRKIPGRIVGKTTDIDGKDGYVLTLQAREQHIRREKASSNICSNHSLCALRGLIYLSVTGKSGLIQIAYDCAAKAEHLKTSLIKTGFFKDAFDGDTFKEFTLICRQNPALLNKELFKKGYIGGLDLDKDNMWLLAVTEKRTYEELDNFTKEVIRICEENL